MKVAGGASRRRQEEDAANEEREDTIHEVYESNDADVNTLLFSFKHKYLTES